MNKTKGCLIANFATVPKKEPASKNIGDEQLSLLRLLAGKFPHEIRMLRALFNENDNHCQLIAHIIFIHD
ncbi:TPA: hypothetical protein NDT96_005080 [Escherichia coli]|nr:hypothetical protein [Escherichia coli]